MSSGRHRGRDYMNNPSQDDRNSRESTARSYSPAARYYYRGPRPSPTFAKPRVYTQQSGRPHPFDGTSDNYDDLEEEEEEEGEEDDFYRGAGASNDNPLYELEDEGSRLPSPREGSPNNNPLYGNDPFQPATSQAVCMTDFLRPKGQRPQRQNQSPDVYDERTYIPIGRSTAFEETRSPSPPAAPLRRTGGKGVFRAPQGQRAIIKSYPPARFSPVIPGSPIDYGPLASGPKAATGKHILKQSQAATTSGKLPKAQPQFGMQSIGDLIAAVRSDTDLHLGESRRDSSREPRIAGDHDRYFAPRKGDIIVHFTPTPDDNKLVEYFDERRTMLRLQAGDKLVRVKYDNYKIQDHLMITSKLYLYCPDWVYLGKAVQTIKTA